MDLVAIIKAILPVDPSQLKPEDRALRPGDHLMGRVIKLHGDNKVMMEFNNFRALTEVPVQVREGQILNLEVAQVGNPLRLKIIPSVPQPSGETIPDATAKPFSAPLPELLRQLGMDLKTLEDRVPNLKIEGATLSGQTIQSALKTLSQFISGLDMVSDPKTLAAQLKARIENSGILFEKKLEGVMETLSQSQVNIESSQARALIDGQIRSDFKPTLLQLLEYVGNWSPEASIADEEVKQRLQRGLKALVDDLGQQKETAVKRNSSQDPFQVFQMVIPLPEREETARLKIYYTKKQKKEPQPNPKVSLLLDLKNLGLVRSDFLMMQNDLSVTIYVTDSKIKDYFETQIEPIGKILEDHFAAVSLAVRVSEKKIKAFDAPLQIEDHEYKVDLRI